VVIGRTDIPGGDKTKSQTQKNLASTYSRQKRESSLAEGNLIGRKHSGVFGVQPCFVLFSDFTKDNAKAGDSTHASGGFGCFAHYEFPVRNTMLQAA
jgi:hypothetical protein